MERISVTQAVRHFSDLLNRVFYQWATVELERGNKVIAGISPVGRKSSLSKQGQMIGAHDLIITVTAIVHNCAVLTENIKELERVPGLETISFVNPS